MEFNPNGAIQQLQQVEKTLRINREKYTSNK